MHPINTIKYARLFQGFDITWDQSHFENSFRMSAVSSPDGNTSLLNFLIQVQLETFENYKLSARYKQIHSSIDIRLNRFNARKDEPSPAAWRIRAKIIHDLETRKSFLDAMCRARITATRLPCAPQLLFRFTWRVFPHHGTHLSVVLRISTYRWRS